MSGRPPLRPASISDKPKHWPDTSPPVDGGEEGRVLAAEGALAEPRELPKPSAVAERRDLANPGALPLPHPCHPCDGGEVARRAGVGDALSATRSRRRAGTTARARSLRQGDNQAEALFWLELNRRQLGGYKFTRQLPIGPYFAGFACGEKWLVVEVDGSQHENSQYDRRRDDFMCAEGYSILRFWNVDVLKERTSVCETILAALAGQLAENVVAHDLRYVHSPRHRPESRP
jgi:very-short-patch-repair endonuclease